MKQRKWSIGAMLVAMIVMGGSVVRAETGAGRTEKEQKFSAALENLNKAMSSGGGEGVMAAADQLFSAGAGFGAVISGEKPGGGSTGPTNPNPQPPVQRPASPAKSCSSKETANSCQDSGGAVQPQLRPAALELLPKSTIPPGSVGICWTVCVQWGTRENGTKYCISFEISCR